MPVAGVVAVWLRGARFRRRRIDACFALVSAQRVLNSAKREHHDEREREENDERANEPRRAGGPAAAPFPMAHASAGRIGEALAHVRGAAEC